METPKVVVTERIEGFAFFHSRSDGPQQQFHIHPNAYEINLVKCGNVDFQIGNTRYHMRPGDVSMIRSNTLHGFLSLDGTEYERFPVLIEDTFLMELCTEQTDLFRFFGQSRPRQLNAEQARLYEYLVDRSIQWQNEKNFGDDIRIRSTLSLLILLAGAAPTVDNYEQPSSLFPSVVRDALAFINENFTRDITLQNIADACNISRSRLCHTFKDLMGISLWNYVISMRINYAQTLLNAGVSVTDACYECGFRDYAHFIKSFHKLTGTTPGQYKTENLRK